MTNRWKSMAAWLITLVIATPAVMPAQAAPAYEGAFARVYPEAASLLRGFETAHAATLERLYTRPGMPAEELEGGEFARLVEQIGAGTARAGTMRAAMPQLARAMPRLAGILDRAHALHWEIYDIYADDRVVNKAAAVDAAVERYLSDPQLALPDRPKSMDIMTTGPYAQAFRERFPKTNGLMWASHWLQLALYDPLMYYATAADRQSGVAVVTGRFRDKLASPPDNMPTEMPTPAAISPELVRRYPRAAAIFDNLHMLHDVIADALVHESVPNREVAVEEAVRIFTDPAHLAVANNQWLLMSLRHGIFNQGGPAIGTLTRTERNVSHHGMHGVRVFSGMGSGADGQSVVGDQPPAPAPHVGH